MSGAVLLGILLAGCHVPGDPPTEGEAAAPRVVESTHEDDPRVQVSAPAADSPRGKALAAISRAEGFALYSLRPFSPPPPPDDAPEYGSTGYADFHARYMAAEERKREQVCRKRGCVAENEILGKTTVLGASDIRAVRTALHDSLAQVPDFGTACAPIYRHAIGFHADGVHYQILLCYECGKVGVVADGDVLEYADQTYGMGEEAALNAILARKGIALSDQAGRSR